MQALRKPFSAWFGCCRPAPALPEGPAAATATSTSTAPFPSTSAAPAPRRATCPATPIPPAVDPVDTISSRLCTLFRRRHFEAAALGFVDGALGPQADGERCCALLRWLDQASQPGGELAGPSGRPLALHDLVLEIGARGRRQLAEVSGRRAADHALQVLAQAWEQADFPPLGATPRPRRPVEQVLRDWVQGLLEGMPLHLYYAPASATPPGVARPLTPWQGPSHRSLMALLRHLGPGSLASALLRQWVPFWRRAPWEGVGRAQAWEDDERLLDRLGGLLERIVAEEAGATSHARPLDPATLGLALRCLVEGLAQACPALPAATVQGLADRLVAQAHAHVQVRARAGWSESSQAALREYLPDPWTPPDRGVPPAPIVRPSLHIPREVHAGPGEPEARQDAVSAWFRDAITRLQPPAFVQARQALYTHLLGAATRATPQRGRRPLVPPALDDEVAGEGLRGLHTALPMFYASYAQALGPLLEAARTVASRADPGPSGALGRTLLWARLGRHAAIVEGEQAWLRAWADAGQAALLGNEAAAYALGQLRQSLGEVIGALAHWGRDAPSSIEWAEPDRAMRPPRSTPGSLAGPAFTTTSRSAAAAASPGAGQAPR